MRLLNILNSLINILVCKGKGKTMSLIHQCVFHLQLNTTVQKFFYIQNLFQYKCMDLKYSYEAISRSLLS